MAMTKINYGEKISVIVRDAGYGEVAIRFLTERRVAKRATDDLWQLTIDTATIPRSVLDGVDNILDITAFSEGNPVAMGSVEIVVPAEKSLTLDAVEG